MKIKYIQKGRGIIIVAFLFAATVLLVTSLYIKGVQSDYVLQTKIKIAEQETRLAALSEITDRDGADAVVEKIIKDCSVKNRDRFDILLSNLSQLQYDDLVEVKQLFDACGSYYAERKSVMVARMQREYEVYLDYVEILSLVDDRIQTVSQKPEQWGELVGLERKRAAFSGDLVAIQGRIITALLEGVTVSSPEMQQMLKDAKNAKDSLIYLNDKIDTLRQEIIGL